MIYKNVCFLFFLIFSHCLFSQDLLLNYNQNDTLIIQFEKENSLITKNEPKRKEAYYIYKVEKDDDYITFTYREYLDFDNKSDIKVVNTSFLKKNKGKIVSDDYLKKANIKQLTALFTGKTCYILEPEKACGREFILRQVSFYSTYVNTNDVNLILIEQKSDIIKELKRKNKGASYYFLSPIQENNVHRSIKDTLFVLFDKKNNYSNKEISEYAVPTALKLKNLEWSKEAIYTFKKKVENSNLFLQFLFDPKIHSSLTKHQPIENNKVLTVEAFIKMTPEQMGEFFNKIYKFYLVDKTVPAGVDNVIEVDLNTSLNNFVLGRKVDNQ